MRKLSLMIIVTGRTKPNRVGAVRGVSLSKSSSVLYCGSQDIVARQKRYRVQSPFEAAKQYTVL